ncbi:MAG: hypothetical protein QOD72_2333 [Acidimicrobiaceae bacterium]|nr:hypothetical protein [Acidimicrobiaceae bacterium]
MLLQEWKWLTQSSGGMRRNGELVAAKNVRYG